MGCWLGRLNETCMGRKDQRERVLVTMAVFLTVGRFAASRIQFQGVICSYVYYISGVRIRQKLPFSVPSISYENLEIPTGTACTVSYQCLCQLRDNLNGYDNSEPT